MRLLYDIARKKVIGRCFLFHSAAHNLTGTMNICRGLELVNLDV